MKNLNKRITVKSILALFGENINGLSDSDVNDIYSTYEYSFFAGHIGNRVTNQSAKNL